MLLTIIYTLYRMLFFLCVLCLVCVMCCRWKYIIIAYEHIYTVIYLFIDCVISLVCFMYAVKNAYFMIMTTEDMTALAPGNTNTGAFISSSHFCPFIKKIIRCIRCLLFVSLFSLYPFFPKGWKGKEKKRMNNYILCLSSVQLC